MIESGAFGWCNLVFGLVGQPGGRTRPDAALVALECFARRVGYRSVYLIGSAFRGCSGP